MNKMTVGKKRYVKRKLREQKPTIWIGKNGASHELLNEIQRQLEKEKAVKVKILKSALAGDETKQIASIIVKQTGASLVEIRGHTLMLFKSNKK
jgi:RNA-binding protein